MLMYIVHAQICIHMQVKTPLTHTRLHMHAHTDVPEMEKDARALNFTAVLIFVVFSRALLKVFCLFCAILGIFANFARFWAFFAHILCANFSDSKFCVCYFVSFFHPHDRAPYK